MIESDIWLVSKDGNDSNSGHPSAAMPALADDAKLTIGAARAAASSGDAIIIYPGDYDEGNLSLSGKSLRLIGVDKNLCRLIPTSGHALMSPGDGTLIRNLTLDGRNGGNLGINASSGCDRLSIESCNIYGAFDAIAINNSKDVRIIDTLLRGEFDGCNIGNVEDIFCLRTKIYCDGTYGSQHARAIYAQGARGLFLDCIIVAERTDGANYICAGIDTLSASQAASLVFNNCKIKVTRGASNSNYAVGIKSSYSGDLFVLNNCLIEVDGVDSYIYGAQVNGANSIIRVSNSLIRTTASGTPTERVDLKQSSGALNSNATYYSSSDGTINDDQGQIRKLLEADLQIDKSDPAQYKVGFFEKGTAVEILRKQLKDVNGSPIINTNTIIGQWINESV